MYTTVSVNVLADTIKPRYAYQNGKIDPKWNPCNQQPEGGFSSLGQSSSMPIARPVSKTRRGYAHGTRGGSLARYTGGRGQSPAMASVQRNATLRVPCANNAHGGIFYHALQNENCEELSCNMIHAVDGGVECLSGNDTSVKPGFQRPTRHDLWCRTVLQRCCWRH